MSISTGYKNLDQMLDGGFQNGRLYVLAARPCMGKTGFALSVLNNICQKNNKTAILFSTEAGRCLTMARLLSIDCGVDPWKIQNFNMKEDEWNKMKQAAMERKRHNLIIDDATGINIERIRLRCLDNMVRDGERLSLAVIDQMKYMTRGDESQTQESEWITEKLKSIAEEFDIPILVVSQLSDGQEYHNDRRPILSDLNGLKAVDRCADAVLFLYRGHYYDRNKDDHISEIIVAKNKTGDCGIIELGYDPDVVKFEELQEVV